MTAARFPKTYCSQCGGEFGPGNAGFSHCSDHAPTTPAADAVQLRDILIRLHDEADLCRNDGADDIAQLLDDAVKHIQTRALEFLSAEGQATARESALVAERDALRAAMDHIAKTCLASRSQSRRIRWIEARARGALLGQNDLHRMIDLPKDGGPATAEKLQRRIAHERHMHNIANGLTAGILGAALSATAVEGV